MARRSIEDLRKEPPKLSDEARARLATIAEHEIEATAKTDDTAPEWTDAALESARFARHVRRTRQDMKLSQNAFAKRYHIAPARLRDWEQARHRPDSVAQAYMRVIMAAPSVVDAALANEASSAPNAGKKPGRKRP